MDSATIIRLENWLKAEGIAFGPVGHFAPLAGGTQNKLVRFQAGDGVFVLRCPSANARPGAEDTIRREAKVLEALRGTVVPHAGFRGYCADRSVLGVAFLLTDAVRGFNATVKMPPFPRENPAGRHAMGLAMIDGIVALAGVDHKAQGLEDFGRLEGFVDRQVPRWARQLASYADYEGWPGPTGLQGIEMLGKWLDGHRPEKWQGGLMHGDYHIGNVLFDAADGSLAAILDWELATLGDPLLDLGRLLAAWPDPDGEGPLSLKVEPWTGFPERDELIARYAAGTGRAMDTLLWYEVLACYKLATILEGTHARARAGLVDAGVGKRLHNSARRLIARGIAWLEQRA